MRFSKSKLMGASLLSATMAASMTLTACYVEVDEDDDDEYSSHVEVREQKYIPLQLKGQANTWTK